MLLISTFFEDSTGTREFYPRPLTRDLPYPRPHLRRRFYFAGCTHLIIVGVISVVDCPVLLDTIIYVTGALDK